MSNKSLILNNLNRNPTSEEPDNNTHGITDQNLVQGLQDIANFVFKYDVKESNSFIFISNNFKRQLSFWENQISQDNLHSILGIAEALLIERTEMLKKVQEFLKFVIEFMGLCPEFC